MRCAQGDEAVIQAFPSFWGGGAEGGTQATQSSYQNLPQARLRMMDDLLLRLT